MNISTTRFSRFAPITVAALIAFAGLVVAGPLNPPVGAITSTGKTLTEVEPRIAINATNTPGDVDSTFKITQPGSYYLTGNVQGVSNKHGIEIAVSGVTLDLNGFELNGIGPALDGVSVTTAGLGNIEIGNGTIRNWGGEGIDFNTTPVVGCRITDVQSRGNASDGILAGANTIIKGCTATQNFGIGINSNTACIIEQCASYGNSSNGIVVNSGCMVRDCVSRSNAFHGISVGSLGNVIIGNNCSNNGATADGANIFVAVGAQDNRIEGNNCSGADRGIDIDGTGNIVIKNTCTSNTVNWSIVAGNAIAPITIATTNASAINGSTYTGNLGNADPNANFSY